MIEFQQVNKAYRVGGRDIPALHATDLTIEAGQVYGIIGHSGAGKSTLLRLINRLEEPSNGRIMVAGEDTTALNAEGLRRFRQRVGMIFQHFNLLSSATVADNVALPLRLAGSANRQQIAARVASLLDRVGLSDHASKYPAQLSGGQKQRVGIARALATEPSILLCDEATSALDPHTTGQVLQLLSEINRELNLTIVLITHEMDVIRRVCDQVAVMDGGRIVEQGTVADVFLHPQHPTTRSFVFGSESAEDQADDFGHVSGQILRLTFQGESTFAPLLGQVARETGVDYSILAGRIDRIRDLPYGQLTLALIGGDLSAARERLAAADVHVEVLRG
ncbi:D-methionine transport system ATP-binding protein [Halopseudomonas litoralis]|uniref:Cell division ATP-binding protein FtsE n=1 Tax=Halopseudomonas litoralis TaxID=797277 RepID=A0A1H1XYK5_9GAMM|nr:methionine ABC transporter ATP-binding protein [Halopseudomonas litoralis]SDT13826.1 D-methionine transport system ATP-binding protein [Halopseudomonas litoralis]